MVCVVANMINNKQVGICPYAVQVLSTDALLTLVRIYDIALCVVCCGMVIPLDQSLLRWSCLVTYVLWWNTWAGICVRVLLSWYISMLLSIVGIICFACYGQSRDPCRAILVWSI